MPQIDAVVIAVPDDPGNEIFREIAAAHGVRCFFGSRENVLERCIGALDAEGADIAMHVMGQHCFVDTGAAGARCWLSWQKPAPISSRCRMPSRPISRAKSIRRALLDEVGAAIAGLPEDRAIHFARYAAFIETAPRTFGARSMKSCRNMTATIC